MHIADLRDYIFSQLSAAQCRELGLELWNRGQEAKQPPFSAAQMAELERRLDEIKSGRVQPLAWTDEAFQQLLDGQ